MIFQIDKYHYISAFLRLSFLRKQESNAACLPAEALAKVGLYRVKGLYAPQTRGTGFLLSQE
jgi:hypothetical protein